jgi:hypothetical protein
VRGVARSAERDEGAARQVVACGLPLSP